MAWILWETFILSWPLLVSFITKQVTVQCNDFLGSVLQTGCKQSRMVGWCLPILEDLEQSLEHQRSRP